MEPLGFLFFFPSYSLFSYLWYSIAYRRGNKMSESESQIEICEGFSQIAHANIESLLKELNIDEKIALLSGIA